MNILTIDFETKDPYLDRDLGGGWVFKYNNIPGCDFNLLGCAVRYPDGTSEYITELDRVPNIVKQYDTWLFHNAQYDLGCLAVLGVDAREYNILDTMVMAKLYNSDLLSYSLDNLTSKYSTIRKQNNTLEDEAFDNDVYPWLKKDLDAKKRAEKKGEQYERQKPPSGKLNKWCKSNMDIIQAKLPDTMARYAIADVQATHSLYEFYIKNGVLLEQAVYYSNVTKICVQSRKRGVRVNLETLHDTRDKMIPLIKSLHDKVYEIAGEEFNIGSTREVAKVFDKFKIPYKYTELGNATIDSKYMESLGHPLCLAIVEAKKAVKLDRDFLKTVLNMQAYTAPNQMKCGRIFPEINVMRAKTGRFSSSNPNCQQIPNANTELGSLIRKIFVPEEGQKWYSLDYSGQEVRLQISDAVALRCEGAVELQQRFIDNSKFDIYAVVEKMAGITRDIAKVIYLGTSYGMGIKSLARKLNITEDKAQTLRNKFNRFVPWLSELFNRCKAVGESRGSIKTLKGRYVTVDKNAAFKALNYRTQGSAGDQTIEAMIQLYEQRIDILFPVHDEICLSGDLTIAKKAANIMENAYKLNVPVVVKYNEIGADNWGDAKN